MARARVYLRRCASFQGWRGEQWRQGQVRVLTDAAAINYYRGQTEFSVEDLPEAQVVPPPAPSAPAASPEVADEPEPDPEALDEEATRFTSAELMQLKKAELVELGSEAFGLQLDASVKKDALVAALLQAQG